MLGRSLHDTPVKLQAALKAGTLLLSKDLREVAPNRNLFFLGVLLADLFSLGG